MEQQTQQYCLRVEAVNLDHAVFDTHDISTIRGGSFMLLDAVNTLDAKVPALKKEVAGASVGLFLFSCRDDDEKIKILADVEKELEKYAGKFATFVHACLSMPKKEDEFTITEQRLTAECRWQQYQMLSFVLPETSAKDECEMNGVRPADDTIYRSDGAVAVSKAVKERFDNGRNLRDALYTRLLGKSETPEARFTRDLETLAGKTDKGATEENIALIHLDGNKFGSIRADNCLTLKDFKEFNDVVQKEIQEPALERLLSFATKPENKGFRTKNNEVRLETLLWGGDEIEWIVPASQLWDTLQIFFDAASNKPFRETSLTYSAGVVVCRHSVPILQIRRYAEQLCGTAKAAAKKDDGPSNQFTLLNMASFDAIHRDVSTFLDNYYHPATTNDFIVTFSQMSALRQHVRTITKYFPKNKLYDIITELQTKRNGEKIDTELQSKKETKVNKIVDRAVKMINKPLKAPVKKAIDELTASNPNMWFLISDIWSLVEDNAHESAI